MGQAGIKSRCQKKERMGRKEEVPEEIFVQFLAVAKLTSDKDRKWALWIILWLPK